MPALQIDLVSLFIVVEAAIVLLALVAALAVRSKSLSARLQTLQRQKIATDPTPPVSFVQYLRDELLRNQGLYEQAAASSAEEDKRTADLLSVRRQFLELEVAAREFEKNPLRFQATLADGFKELVEQWRPEAETVDEPAAAVALEPDESAGREPDAPAPDESLTEPAETLDAHEQEFDRLKQVIVNQQDAMSALRSELQAREAEFNDLEGILAKLDEFERHDAELHRCLQELDEENQRLKTARAAGDADGATIQRMEPAQLTGLKTMIGNQQQTIGNLQSLIRELAPEAGKAAELETAIANIQQANQELSGCVAVLEDENAMLRSELEAVNTQLEHQDEADGELAEAAAAPAVDEPDRTLMAEGDEEEHQPPAAAAVPDEEKYQLEIKVQELEALLEFKDAAIEELEKQVHSLEAKCLTVNGDT